MRLHKPIGIMLLLWPTLWAVFIAGRHHFSPHIFIIFTMGVILMRSAGCVINDFADRGFDGYVARTRNRPMVTGQVTSQQATTLFLLLSGLAFILVLTTNLLTILLAIPGILLAASYPFMKRFTNLPQVILGLAFSWGIPMAFAAQHNSVPPVAWLLMLANILWTIAYDTQYAMVDREDDLKIGIKSTAILFGNHDRLLIGILYIATIIVLFMVGLIQNFAPIFYFAVCIASLFALYQQYLIHDRLPQQCFKAFLNNNWFGLLITLGIFSAVV